MKKNVVFVNQSAGYLMIDIVNAYASQYDKIALIAGVIKPMERELSLAVETQKIIRYNRRSRLSRLFTWGWGTIQIFFLLQFKYYHYEVIYTTNPPLAYLLSLMVKQRYSIIVYDIYPDALINIGVKRNNILYRWWNRSNTILFNKAQKLITISNGMANRLSLNTDREKIKVISNWSGSDKFTPVKKEENPFIKDNNLGNKFIVLYSGNIGYTHSVESIVEVAKALEQEESIYFLIIGEGGRKEKLIQLSKQYNLTNCSFMTWQTSDILPYSLASADLAIITINDESAETSVPSKTYNLLAVGAPLLCITPPNSELAALVEKYNNGQCFEKDNTSQMASFILTVSRNETMQKEFSNKSREAARFYNYSNAMEYL